jgi:CMP/dCMP kinase
VLQRGIPVDDEAGVSALANAVQIDVQPPTIMDGRDSDVLVDGQDVTWAIRTPAVNTNVSPISAYPQVRDAMTRQQRRIGLRGQVVMVGRDIGTVVLPEAGLKIYLDASPERRAERRYQEIIQRGEMASLEEILASICRRDQIDTNREIAPLRPAQDAVILDSDRLSIDEVFSKVKSYLK